MKKLLYLLLPFIASTALAQQPYVSNGPKGGQARAFDLQTGRTLLGGRGAVYEHLNGQWMATSPSWTALSCATITSLYGNAGNLVAGTLIDGVHFSNDGGATWTDISGDIRKGIEYRSVLLAAPNYLAVRADSGALFLSQDGVSWVRKNFSLQNAAVGYLSFHNNIVYATSNNGLYQSMDNGQTFMQQNPSGDLSGKMLWKNDTLWVAGGNGLRMSTDAGMTFSPAILSGRPVGSVAVQGNNLLVTVRGNGGVDSILYSGNGGLTFTTVLPGSGIRFRNVYDLTAETNNFLAGTDQGVLFANLNNTGWRTADSGFHARQITHFGSASTGVIYATATEDGGFRTADSAASWTGIASAFNGAEANIQAIDGDLQNVYVAGATAFYRSTNGGASYTAGVSGLPATGFFSSVLVSRRWGSGVLTIANGSPYLAGRGGSIFNPVQHQVPAGASRTLFAADTNTYIAALNDSLYHSGDTNFIFRRSPGIWGGVSGVAYNKRIFYAATRKQGLFSSADGINWSPVAAPGIPSKINAIAAKDTTIYLGTDNGMISNISGSWAPDSLQGQIIYALKSDSTKLYAGTCNGVWTRKNLPAPPPPVDTTVDVRNTYRTLGAMQLYPNPATGDFSTSFGIRSAGTATLTLSDLTGRPVYRATHAVSAGSNVLSIPAASLGLAAGMYFLEVRSGAERGVLRVLMQSK